MARLVSKTWMLALLLVIYSCEEESEPKDGGLPKDAGTPSSDATNQSMDAETRRPDSSVAAADGESAVEDDASDNEECEPGGVFGGQTEDRNVPPKIRTTSDLAVLEGYEELRADLMIPFDSGEESEIDSLGQLHCLNSVGGLCVIGPLIALKGLDGLESLTSVAWGMTISGNDKLTNVDGLVGLESVGKGAEREQEPSFGSLAIGSNSSLLDLKGLANLSYLRGNLFIRDNKSLPTCEAVELKERLERAGWTGEATICGNLHTHRIC
jgi:hypothetical protein